MDPYRHIVLTSQFSSVEDMLASLKRELAAGPKDESLPEIIGAQVASARAMLADARRHLDEYVKGTVAR